MMPFNIMFLLYNLIKFFLNSKKTKRKKSTLINKINRERENFVFFSFFLFLCIKYHLFHHHNIFFLFYSFISIKREFDYKKKKRANELLFFILRNQNSIKTKKKRSLKLYNKSAPENLFS